MKFGLMITPYSFIIGISWDPNNRSLVIMPIPGIGLLIGFDR
jgi:hypothetical protein